MPRRDEIEQLTPRFAGYPSMVRRRALQLDQATDSDLERHVLLFLLAVEALRHFTSVAFAEYAIHRDSEPDPDIERWLPSLQKPTVGAYVGLLRACTQHVEAGSKLDPDRAGGPNEPRRQLARFGGLVPRIQQALEGRVRGLEWILEDAGETRISWLEFWEWLRDYRNVFFHPEAQRWHEVEDYFEVVTPIFQAAVLDAVTSRYARARMTRCALADLYATSHGAGADVYRFKGEFAGQEDLVSIEIAMDGRPPWLAAAQERGHRTFLLAAADGGYRICGLGHDFSREAKPPLPARPAGATDQAVVLLEILRDPGYAPSLRRRAARKLGYLRDAREHASADLRGCLDSEPDERVSEAAANALGRLGNGEPATVGALAQAMNHRSERVRFASAVALARLGQEASVPGLLSLLDSENGGIRHDAAAALRDLADPAALAQLLSQLESEEHPAIRHRIAEGLARIGDTAAVEPLLQALDREDDELAWGGIAWALAQLPDPRSIPTFVRLLASRGGDVERRTSAAYALGLVGGDDARDALIHVLSAKGATQLRVEAAWALWEIADEAARQAVDAAADDDDPHVAAAARAASTNLAAADAVRRPERWLAPS